MTISLGSSVGAMQTVGRTLHLAAVRLGLVAMIFLAAACDEGRSYRVVPTSATEGGVILAISEPVSIEGDFSYTIHNGSAECIAMTRVDLPRGHELFLDGILNLVDEAGRSLNRAIDAYPDETVREIVRLEPNEQLTEEVDLRQIFGVPHLEGYVASFALAYSVCDANSSAGMRSLRVQEIHFAPMD